MEIAGNWTCMTLLLDGDAAAVRVRSGSLARELAPSCTIGCCKVVELLFIYRHEEAIKRYGDACVEKPGLIGGCGRCASRVCAFEPSLHDRTDGRKHDQR